MSIERAGRAVPALAVSARALPVVLALTITVLYGAGLLVLRGSGASSAGAWWLNAAAAGTAVASLLVSVLRPVTRAQSADPGPESDGRGMLEQIRTRPEFWFALAAFAWFLGAVVTALSPSARTRAAVGIYVADPFLLAAIVLLFAGFAAAVVPPRGIRAWLRHLADGYVCFCALFVTGWVAVLGTLFRRSGESAGEFLVEMMYPLADMLVLCAVLPIVLGAARRESRVAYAALLAITAADVLTLAARLTDGTAAGGFGDVFRLGGLVLLAAAPWTAEKTAEKEGTRRPAAGPGPATAIVVGGAVAFVAVYWIIAPRRPEPVVLLVAGSAILVLAIRLGQLVRDNDRLKRAVNVGEEHFRALAASVDETVLVSDPDGLVADVSQGAGRTDSYRPADFLQRRLHEIVHPEDQDVIERALAGELGGGVVTCRIPAPDGTWVPTELTLSRYARTGDEGEDRLLITMRDLSEKAALERQVTHLTFHDGLTGLPNRAYFEERAREVLARHPGSRDARAAVLFIDLDRFTAVNDSIGHGGGDQALAQAARRLRAAVKAEDTVARWGGDEFAVLVEAPSDAQAVVDLAERLLRVLSADPYHAGDRDIVLTASVGVAFAEVDSQGGDSPADLVRNADVALSRATDLGGGRVEIFAAHMHADVVRRLELGSDLQRALAEKQFTIEFQPVVELATSRVSGVEALVRWQRGSVFVSPEEFIGPAEESGLIVPIGNWVLREACGEVARWRASSWEIGLAVNLSRRQITAPRFVESVAGALKYSGLPASALTLEVKEEVLVEDAEEIIVRLSALRDLGVRLAIDDFGTGYASLAYLRQLPVDVIKIDPSFVAGLGRDDTLSLLTRTIVQLGHDLGLIVVAEGIERPEQLELLREMNCPRGQGFLVARPMAPRHVEALVRTSVQGGKTIPLQGTAAS